MLTSKRTLILATAAAALPLLAGSVQPRRLAVAAQQPTSRYAGWPAYGGTVDQIRYSSLKSITPANVNQLRLAWSYDSGETGGLQTQPIVVDDVLYGSTPTHKAFALRAATGELLWTFDSGIKGQGANRGLMYWSDGADRRVYAAVEQYVYALDAATGTVVPGFGEGGRIDLRRDLGRDPAAQWVRLTTPGVVYRELLILGGRVSETLPASPGFVRAYNVRTGALVWTFRTIPAPGESGSETWSQDSWLENGGANNWPGMALDEGRGMLFVPTGSAAADFYGGNRIGDNLFANSLLALDAATGKRIWHYQLVHHDIWDRDPPSPPNLVTLRRKSGETVDAVVQVTKHGYVFVFDRVTGKPLFPIEERPFPASDILGERTSPTQPIPIKPLPFARQVLTPEVLTSRTPEARAWALRELATFRNDGLFVPFTVGRQTVVFPGFDGGPEWGGQAFDPETGLYYVNANDLAWSGSLAPSEDLTSGGALYRQHCATCHRDDRQGSPPAIPTLVGLAPRRTRPEVATMIQKGGGRMPGFPTLSPEAISAIVEYLVGSGDAAVSAAAAGAPKVPFRFTGYRKFLDPDGYPAVAPPWGTLTAIDLNTGDRAWQIPLGEYPELVAQGLRNTGSENYGGPVVTAGGLVFIAATNFDRKLRAFDKRTGTLLWETSLPFSGNATPAVYQVNGRQFIAIAAGGGKGARGSTSGGVYVAFALPR